MNSNIIVQEEAKDIRAIARMALKDNWVNVTIGFFVFYVLDTVMPEILSVIFRSASYQIPYSINSVFDSTSIPTTDVSFVADLYTLVVSGALMVGLCSFFLAFFRRKDVNPANVFNGFENFGKALGLFLIYMLKIFAWSLLLIVPGIIAAIRYSQCFFILADDPSKGVMQCIEESKFHMFGNKGRYFYLGLTFIGWMILAQIPSSIVANFTNGGIIGLVLDVVMCIPVYFVYAYMYTSETVFYDLVTGKLVAKKAEPEIAYEEPPRTTEY